MAKYIQIEGDIFVAPQLSEDDFAELSSLGFKSVVCNRPDGESEGQLPSGEAGNAAHRHGLEFRYQPVSGFDVTDDDAVDTFTKLAGELPGPTLFYCKSGTRCAILWAQSAVADLGIKRTLEIAKAAGYDLSSVAEILEERAYEPVRPGRIAA